MRKFFIGCLLACALSVPVSAATMEQVHQSNIEQKLSTPQGVIIKKSVKKYSDKYGVDPNLVHAVIMVESTYNPKATSSCGAQGLMQLMPTTFKARNVGNNAYDIDQNIHAGVKHLAGLSGRHNGNWYLALASYNAGGGRVPVSSDKVPHFTKKYVDRVFYYKKIIELIQM